MGQQTNVLRRFEGQVAVVSGAADGLGKQIALRLAREGAQLHLFDSNEHKLEETITLLQSEGCIAGGHCVDISDEHDVKQGFETVFDQAGRIDVMVNAAGVVGPTGFSIVDYDVSDFDYVYQVNLRGSFLMTKYAIPVMVKHNYGRILLIASISGKEGNPLMVGYSSSKAGVIGLVKGVGKEFAKTKITINGLAPALIKTAMFYDIAPEQQEYMINKVPMNRLGTVDEVAAISCFIVSRENSFSTGFIYDVSGGRATY